jgi:putative membrane protein
MENAITHPIVSAIIFSILGVLVWIGAYYVIEKITPENTWAEITKNKNTAVAIIFGSMIIAIALIISAAIHG